MSRERLDELIALGEDHRAVRVHYRSRLTPTQLLGRVIEPYNLTQGKEDVLVRAYQLEPEEGWRYFMAHKIDRVEDAGRTFEPRREVTLAQDSRLIFEPPRAGTPWTDAMRRYRDLVVDALAEGLVGKPMFDEIHDFAASSGLTDEQVRYVHASLFYRLLGAILRDGTVAEPQLAEIRHVQRVLKGLGWAVAGSKS
jgi:predicted DNA-binding transcriptional regulator YafY